MDEDDLVSVKKKGENKMYSDSTKNIKKLIDSDSYVIVYDTNIFLNLYRISPDYADSF